ncbi:GNAT family N-acetyltransferase [Brumimicrobium aurantiacum]|uniref:GNAT family N-acetyltransferase n=1 Tax=Brumimicrobium aurantiacum TaxID=1737063 RepID=A0A3E1EW15_9FLAO|nr:GNAT family N-acetyltransferase [Brumimicrobium aurantiacum]RFC53751.1 GNAT family N-acetyltransferase [Brumimicrobium aurantiacum]
MINWECLPFSELTIDEFHDLLALRIKVFVVEQNCPYQEVDGKDKCSFHLIGRDSSGKIVGTLRILPKGISYDEVSIGRVVLDETVRGNGCGHQMMKEALSFCKIKFGPSPIVLSAQKHLEKYYNHHQFVSTGKEYLEDGIPHVEMRFIPK